MVRCVKFFILAFLLFFLNIYPQCISSAQSKFPHGIILISLDTLRADHLGIYGYHRNTSPNIDSFAKESIVFENAVVQSAWTLPSHMSIMTSLYPSSHGVKNVNQRLAEKHLTLAELLRDKGYQTAGFADGLFMQGEYGFKQGFDIYDGDKLIGLAQILPKVKKWLDKNKADPFFVFIHCYDIHDPYNPPSPYNSIFHDFNYTGNFIPDSKNMQAAAWRGLEVNDEDLRHIQALYDGGIRYTDEKIGEFLSYLQDTGLKDKTLIIITSDHGEEFKEHGSFLHWQLYYRPDLHVPLIMRIPNYPKKEIRINEVVQSIDILPTILDIAALQPHQKAQGKSLLPSIKRYQNFFNRSLALLFQPSKNIAFAERYGSSSIITDSYQLIYNLQPKSFQLFDLKDDPLAQNNIAKGHDDLIERLFLEHNEIYNGLPIDNAPTFVPNEETREKLKALGYIGNSGQ